MLKSFIVLLSSLFITGCGSLFSPYALFENDNNVNKTLLIVKGSVEYHILPQDRVKIIFYRNPQQSSKSATGELGQPINSKGILVDTAGYVSLPLIGKLKIGGLTQTQASDFIKQQLRRYLNNPSVYVEVLNKRIYILGEVKSPGIIELTKEKMTLFEAIASVGGFTEDAVKDEIIIVSDNDGQKLTMRTVNLTDFEHIKYASLLLRPNEIIYVQASGWKEFKSKASNFTSPFDFISKLATPFLTFKFLTD